MRADSLEKGLQTRPSPEELVKKGILQGMLETHLLCQACTVQSDIGKRHKLTNIF